MTFEIKRPLERLLLIGKGFFFSVPLSFLEKEREIIEKKVWGLGVLWRKPPPASSTAQQMTVTLACEHWVCV